LSEQVIEELTKFCQIENYKAILKNYKAFLKKMKSRVNQLALVTTLTIVIAR
jgi:hypothetical protein